jgi:16S rRNA processing protein RimM
MARGPKTHPAPAGHVLVAEIGAAHGIKGEVRVKSFTQAPLAAAGYGPLRDAEGRVFAPRSAREIGGGMLVMRFAGIDDRNAAEALNGTELHVPRSALPPAEEGEFYHADLIGLAAVAPDGTPVGTVVGVHNFGAGDIIEIAPPQGATLLLPFTEAAVPAVDIAGGRLTVVPPAEIEARDEGDTQEESP